MLLLVLLSIVLLCIVTHIVRKKERFSSYLPSLPVDVADQLTLKLQDGLNQAIQATKDSSLSSVLNRNQFLSPSSTLNNLIFHSDDFEGQTYKRSGGCKTSTPSVCIPLVGCLSEQCLCYIEGEGAITRVRNLGNNLRVSNLANLRMNINFKTNKVAITFDMTLEANNVYVNGTGRGKLCVDSWIGFKDSYLIEFSPELKCENCVVFGTYNPTDQSVTVNMSSLQADISLTLRRTDWFSSIPSAVKTILDQTLGQIGDIFWDKVSSILKTFLSSQILSFLKGAGDVTIPYGSLPVLASMTLNYVVPMVGYSIQTPPQPTQAISIGDWIITNNQKQLVIQSKAAKVAGAYLFDSINNMIRWSSSVSFIDVSIPIVNLPLMFHMGPFIVYSTTDLGQPLSFLPLSQSLYFIHTSDPQKSFKFVVQDQTIQLKSSTEQPSLKEQDIYDSGLTFNRLNVGEWSLLYNEVSNRIDLQYDSVSKQQLCTGIKQRKYITQNDRWCWSAGANDTSVKYRPCQDSFSQQFIVNSNQTIYHPLSDKCATIQDSMVTLGSCDMARPFSLETQVDSAGNAVGSILKVVQADNSADCVSSYPENDNQAQVGRCNFHSINDATKYSFNDCLKNEWGFGLVQCSLGTTPDFDTANNKCLDINFDTNLQPGQPSVLKLLNKQELIMRPSKLNILSSDPRKVQLSLQPVGAYTDKENQFTLLPNNQLQHKASNMCLTKSINRPFYYCKEGEFVLESCSQNVCGLQADKQFEVTSNGSLKVKGVDAYVGAVNNQYTNGNLLNVTSDPSQALNWLAVKQ